MEDFSKWEKKSLVESENKEEEVSVRYLANLAKSVFDRGIVGGNNIIQ